MARAHPNVLPMPRPRITWSQYGYEMFCHPSILARQAWLYALCMGESKCPANFLHGHPDRACQHKDDEGYLLHFILDGEVWHRVGTQRHVARKNQVALLDLSGPVQYGNENGKASHFYWIWFGGKELPKIVGELDARANPIFGNLNRSAFVATWKQLKSVAEREPQGYEARVSALLSSMIADLFAVRPTSRRPVNVRTQPFAASEPVRTALQYIARFYAKPISLKELGAEIGLSVYHFAHVFQAETGYSPMQYLKHYRLEQAKALLAETNMPIERVASSVGIPNHEHFSKLFREVSGMSPTAFRAEVRN